MARKLVSIQRVNRVTPIEGADMIVSIGVLGWNLVTQKSNNLKVGDFVVYFEIDSLLPVREEFEFLRKTSYTKMSDGREGFRIKTMRFRGTIAQGFALPLEAIEEFGLGKLQSVFGFDDYDTLIICSGDESDEIKAIPVIEGTELTEFFGVIKYEPPIPACLDGIAKGEVPSRIVTDETRVQLLQGLLDKYKGILFYAAEKADGGSVSFFIGDDNELHVCSRNLDLLEDDKNSMWKFAKQNDIDAKLRTFNQSGEYNICLQGEIIGEGIQGNKYGLKGQTVLFFNVLDLNNLRYFSFEEFKRIIESMGLQTVPILNENFVLGNDINELVEYSKGYSVIPINGKKVYREGIVLRPLVNIVDATLDVPHSRVSFKVINPEFLLKNNE